MGEPAAHWVELSDVTSLGAALREARKRQGMTQTELAALASVGVRFVSDLERGKDTVQFGLALRLLQLVGLRLLVGERWAVREVCKQYGQAESP